MLCLVSRLDEVEGGCGNPGAFGSGLWGAEVVCGCFGEARCEVIAEEGVGVKGAVGVFGGDFGCGVPEEGDLFLECFFCFYVWFSVVFGCSLLFDGAASFDP